MQFGYFTLSDNKHRSPNQFVADILDEALYAEELGLHSGRSIASPTGLSARLRWTKAEPAPAPRQA
jgi:hypothetical protein